MMTLPMPAESNTPKVSAREAFAGDPKIEVRSSDPGWISLAIAPEMEMKQRMSDFFRAQLTDLPDDLCDKLAMAFEELLGNSIEHGSVSEPKRGVEIGFIRTPRMLLFHIRDAGPGFSLSSVPHAAVNNPPEDPLKHAAYRSEMGLRPGGFGILLVKQIADELIYNEHGNAVLMIKYFDPAR
jgi:anti-sigma regulatory factor (Ser/Thr protein kinase)